MKQKAHLAGMLIAATLVAGCGTVVRTLPLPATATAQGMGDVPLYFGAQPHPAVKTDLGQRSESVRVARASEAEQPTCDSALSNALVRLRADAKKRGGNAVVNVTTRFHDNHSDSATQYTCGVSRSAGAIVVSGDVVVLDAQ